MAGPAPFSYAFASAAAAETIQELHLVASVSHRGEAGRAREGILRRFLSRLVPPAFGLEPGFVIDGHGDVSGQIDLVLYRTGYYPILEVGGVKHFPVEGVIAVFEIKASTDSAGKLTQALEQIETVKVLDRTGGGSNYSLEPMGGTIDPDDFRWQVFGAVLSERSLSALSALEVVETFCESRPRCYWPNLVVTANEYSIRYQSPGGVPGEDAVSPKAYWRLPGSMPPR